MNDDFELPEIVPANIEAEQSVLGAVLIDPNALVTVRDLLAADAFYEPKHRLIYEAMVGAEDAGEPVDIVSVTASLQASKGIGKIGGVAYLSHLANTVPTASNVGYYAGLVADKYRARELLASYRESAAAIQNGADPETVAAKQEARLQVLEGGRKQKSFVTMKDAVMKAYESVEADFNKGGAEAVTGTPSGYPDLDKMTSGFQKSDLIILAARPAVGKTALALNLAQNVAIRAQETVAIFSLEMSVEQLTRRMMAAEGNIDASRIRSGQLTEDDWPKMTMVSGVLAEAPIFIDDTPGITVQEIRSKLRRLKQEHGVRLVVIDYLQLIQGKGGGNGANRQQEVSEISRMLKLIARELNVTIIALSQLSRSVESRSDKRPMMSDLRESGSIEQDADIVAFLYRDDYYNPQSERKNIVEFIIAKQRSGPTGMVELVFLKNFNKFVNLERAPSA